MPLPSSFAGPAVSRDPLLLWVHTGRAVVTAEGAEHPVEAGHALLLRPGIRYALRTSPGSIAVPLLLSAEENGTPRRPVARIAVPPAWHDRLLFEFIRNLGYLRSDTALPQALPDLIAAAGDPAAGALPPLPRSAEAFRAAHLILQDPGDDASAGDLAAAVRVSERTLQRRFTEETGLSLTAWRTRARIAAAQEHLAVGRSLSWVAGRVGFATDSGFVRAFRRFAGETPGAFQRRMRNEPRTRSSGGTGLAVTADARLPETAPAIPASATWARVNGAHVAVWVHRGSARVEIGERRFALGTGEALILPAGVRTRTEVDEDSLLLPLGFRVATGAPVSVDALRTTLFEPADDVRLLHGLVSTYTPLRPNGHSETGLFDEVARRTTGALPSPVGTTMPDARGEPSLATQLALRVTRDPAADIGLEEWARTAQVDPGSLRRAFRSETGISFPQWRMITRMTQAREQLTLGIPPTAVARNLGYAHLPAFTRAFRTVHGHSPQQFLATERARRAAVDWRREWSDALGRAKRTRV